jgi:hypothetical protein
MAYRGEKLKLICSSSDRKEYIVLGNDYLLINKNGKFKILGKNLEEVIRNLRIIGREDILTEFSVLK